MVVAQFGQSRNGKSCLAKYVIGRNEKCRCFLDPRSVEDFSRKLRRTCPLDYFEKLQMRHQPVRAIGPEVFCQQPQNTLLVRDRYGRESARKENSNIVVPDAKSVFTIEKQRTQS